MAVSKIAFAIGIMSEGSGSLKFIHRTKPTSHKCLFVNSCVQFWREGQI